MGIGSYSIHFIMTESGLPFGVALVVALAIGVVLGLIVGVVSLRIEGIYLVILTLGLSEILRNLYIAVQDSIYLSTLKLFGLTISRSDSVYVVTVLLVIVMMLTHNLIVSPTGRAMLAMKNSTAAAQAMGISLMEACYIMMCVIALSVFQLRIGMEISINLGAIVLAFMPGTIMRKTGDDSAGIGAVMLIAAAVALMKHSGEMVGADSGLLCGLMAGMSGFVYGDSPSAAAYAAGNAVYLPRGRDRHDERRFHQH